MRIQMLGLTLLVIVTTNASGDSELPPYSYAVTSPDGAYVFVMIAPLSPEEDASNWEGEKAEEITAIRRAYRTSGMYRNDGSNAPLWQVNWYGGVEIASDGIHMVRHPWRFRSSDQEALAFFANGRELRSYRIDELVAHPELLPHTTSSILWVEEHRLDDRALLYVITTRNDEHYVFDISTGKVVSGPPKPPVPQSPRALTNISLVIISLSGAVIGLILMGTWRLRKSRGRSSEQDH